MEPKKEQGDGCWLYAEDGYAKTCTAREGGDELDEKGEGREETGQGLGTVS